MKKLAYKNSHAGLSIIHKGLKICVGMGCLIAQFNVLVLAFYLGMCSSVMLLWCICPINKLPFITAYIYIYMNDWIL